MTHKPMPHVRWLRWSSAIALACLLCACRPAGLQPPDSRRGDTVETLHGVEIADPYRWLEDPQSAETRSWIERQGQYTRRVLEQAPPADTIRARLEELYRIDDVSVPIVRRGRYFSARRNADQDLAMLYVRRSHDGADELLIDPHEVSPDGSLSVAYAGVSADGTLAAYRVRRGGEDETEIRFIDVDSGEHLDDVLGRGRYFNVSIDSDRSGVFYDRQTPDGPRVFRHLFGEETYADRMVFGRGYTPDKIIVSELSSNGRYLLVTVHHGAAATRTELHFRDIWTGNQVHPLVTDVEATFAGHIAGDTLFVLTDWEAPNRRLFAANLRQPSIDSWTEIIPEGDTPIESFAAVGGRLVLQRLDNVQPRLVVHEPDGFPVRDIPLPEIGAVEGVAGGTWEDDEVFYAFSSIARPPTVFRYRVSDGMQEAWSEIDAPVDAASFEVSRVTYSSADGTSIPMFVAHRRGLQPDGSHPALLTGYGGFNVSVLPGFDRMAVVWMESGGVWAIPGLRGGGEFGETWHRAGMLENKQNVFDDFIGAAEWLVANNYTRPDKLAIMGASNGGLLVGAALTQRPELFAAVVCAYPLLDMLRYQQFFVAGYWVPEYGSSANPLQFEYLAGYSPYHRVVAGARYPAVMLVSGDSDTRVAPLHARKMTALLQAQTGSAGPVVLLYDAEAGHSGGRPVGDTIEELTAELRFLLWQTRPELLDRR